jgi:hypothetical protein
LRQVTAILAGRLGTSHVRSARARRADFSAHSERRRRDEGALAEHWRKLDDHTERFEEIEIYLAYATGLAQQNKADVRSVKTEIRTIKTRLGALEARP